MDTRILGAIFLVVGTSIGAGILAMPLATAETGFWASVGLLFSVWAVMTLAAMLILQVNLWLAPGTNLVSMARATLGRWGELLTWFIYLSLLYALLCAYISAGGDVVKSVGQSLHLSLPGWLGVLLFTVLFGSIVNVGIKAVDHCNRYLLITKLTLLACLLLGIAPHITVENLWLGHANHAWGSIMVVITSFGYATIIPSLRVYLDSDVKKLRLVVLVGSAIPLLCYLAWELVILGAMHHQGNDGLLAMRHSVHPTADLITAVRAQLGSPWVTTVTQVFTTISVLTSFLGVALCLTDFLADGMRVKKQGLGRITVCLATFMPPLLIVLWVPGLFITALQYAGALCVTLLIVLPMLMAYLGWRRRVGVSVLHG